MSQRVGFFFHTFYSMEWQAKTVMKILRGSRLERSGVGGGVGCLGDGERGHDGRPSVDVGFGNKLRLDDADPWLGFYGGEIVGGDLDFLVAGVGCDGDHVTDGLQVWVGTFARATFEVGELLEHVAEGESREAG